MHNISKKTSAGVTEKNSEVKSPTDLIITGRDLVTLMVSKQSTLRTDRNLIRLTEILQSPTPVNLADHRQNCIAVTKNITYVIYLIRRIHKWLK